jgi:hypothetical protein
LYLIIRLTVTLVTSLTLTCVLKSVVRLSSGPDLRFTTERGAGAANGALCALASGFWARAVLLVRVVVGRSRLVAVGPCTVKALGTVF